MRQTFFVIIEVLRTINILIIKLLFVLGVFLCVLDISLLLLTEKV